MPIHHGAEPDRNVPPRAQSRCRGALSLHPSAPEPLLKCRLMWNSGPKSLVGHPEMKPEEESLVTGPELVAELPVEPRPGLPSLLARAWFAVAWHSRESPAADRQGSRQIKTSASKGPPSLGTRLPPGLARILANSLPTNPKIVAPSAGTGLGRRDIANHVSTARVYWRGA